MFYDNVKKACAEKDVSPTFVLKECGFSTGNLSKWSKGAIPNTELCVKIANYLGVSIDYLLTGNEYKGPHLTDNEKEWLRIISRIPEDKHAMLKDFLKTHMAIPEKYEDKREA